MVLGIVGFVGVALVASLLILRYGEGDVIEPSTTADLDGYCSALDGDIDAALAQLDATATAAQRRAAASTLPLLFSTGFVDGAPPARRDAARRLADAVTGLDDEAAIDPVDAAAVREPFIELQRFRGTDCP